MKTKDELEKELDMELEKVAFWDDFEVMPPDEILEECLYTAS